MPSPCHLASRRDRKLAQCFNSLPGLQRLACGAGSLLGLAADLVERREGHEDLGRDIHLVLQILYAAQPLLECLTLVPLLREAGLRPLVALPEEGIAVAAKQGGDVD